MGVIPSVYHPDAPPGERAEDGDAPPAEDVARMMMFNEALVQAGALVALDGLHPRARGARVACVGGKPNVTDRPVPQVKDVIGGYGMIQANSTEDAVEWARWCPASDGDVTEVREVFEISDVPPDVPKAADNPTVRADRNVSRLVTPHLRST